MHAFKRVKAEVNTLATKLFDDICKVFLIFAAVECACAVEEDAAAT